MRALLLATRYIRCPWWASAGSKKESRSPPVSSYGPLEGANQPFGEQWGTPFARGDARRPGGGEGDGRLLETRSRSEAGSAEQDELQDAGARTDLFLLSLVFVIRVVVFDELLACELRIHGV